MLVYLNGEYLPREEARVPIDDRGFLFADGLYEVVLCHDGHPYLLAEHLRRMADGLRALRIGFQEMDALRAVGERLLDENGLRQGLATLYIQVTRGAAPRKHAFPGDGTAPTVLVSAQPFRPHPDDYYEAGVDAITVPDTRWSRCDIKSIALLPNVLANQAAREAGAFEALLVRDGVLLEGSHSNVFGVFDGTLVTYPVCNYILPGITRARLLQLAERLGIPSREAPIYLHELGEAEEIFLAGTTTEVMPVVRIDGRTVGSGKPGPVTRRLLEAYRTEIRTTAKP